MFRVHTPIIRSIRCWVGAYGFLHRVFGWVVESRCVGRVYGADGAVGLICFGYIRPSSGALDVELQHMVFCTEVLVGWWSWEPLRRSCVRCGWCRATDMFRVHTPIIRSIRCWVGAYGFLHRVFGWGGGLESRCVGRVYGADGAVRQPLNHEVPRCAVSWTAYFIIL